MSDRVRVTAVFQEEIDLARLSAALVELVLQLREQEEAEAASAPAQGRQHE